MPDLSTGTDINYWSKIRTNALEADSKQDPSCCPSVRGFWLKVCEDLSTCLDHTAPVCPSLCLLGNVTKVDLETNRHHIPLAEKQAALRRCFTSGCLGLLLPSRTGSTCPFLLLGAVGRRPSAVLAILTNV
ncbi:hypothetical protein ILYODFUR_018435, partial [Ilyodon furcidens]